MKMKIESGLSYDVVSPGELDQSLTANRRHMLDAMDRQNVEGIKPVYGKYAISLAQPTINLFAYTVQEGFVLSVLFVSAVGSQTGGGNTYPGLAAIYVTDQYFNSNLNTNLPPVADMVGNLTVNAFATAASITFPTGAVVARAGQTVVFAPQTTTAFSGLYTFVQLPAEKIGKLYI